MARAARDRYVSILNSDLKCARARFVIIQYSRIYSLYSKIKGLFVQSVQLQSPSGSVVIPTQPLYGHDHLPAHLTGIYNLPVKPPVTAVTGYHTLCGSDSCAVVTSPILLKHIDCNQDA